MNSFLINNPQVADRIASQGQSARVTLPRDHGPIEITIDLTDVLAATAARPSEVGDTAVTLQWTVTAPVDSVDTTVPSNAADRASCQ
jgi:hypothetical protein